MHRNLRNCFKTVAVSSATMNVLQVPGFVGLADAIDTCSLGAAPAPEVAKAAKQPVASPSEEVAENPNNKNILILQR